MNNKSILLFLITCFAVSIITFCSSSYKLTKNEEEINLFKLRLSQHNKDSLTIDSSICFNRLMNFFKFPTDSIKYEFKFIMFTDKYCGEFKIYADSSSLPGKYEICDSCKINKIELPE